VTPEEEPEVLEDQPAVTGMNRLWEVFGHLGG
jgi:hypothetical protein